MARRRIVLIEPLLMARWLQGYSPEPGESWTSDAPADLTIVGCGWDETRNVMRFAVESSTFDDVPDVYFAPDWTPTFTTHTMSKFEAAMAVLRPSAS